MANLFANNEDQLFASPGVAACFRKSAESTFVSSPLGTQATASSLVPFAWPIPPSITMTINSRHQFHLLVDHRQSQLLLIKHM